MIKLYKWWTFQRLGKCAAWPRPWHWENLGNLGSTKVTIPELIEAKSVGKTILINWARPICFFAYINPFT
jgi:hypothetical protein